MKRLCQISLTIFAICTISVFLLTLSTFGQQKIVCPPNKGISADGSFSNEPLKKDLVTGVITRLDPVDRAIAELACIPNSCGDGEVNGVEQCDKGIRNSDTTPDACRIKCTNPSCGDTVTDTGEQCDDGNTTAGDGCSDKCIREKQCEVASDCGKETQCIKRECNSNICVTLTPSTPCDDGNMCTTGEKCLGGNCLGGVVTGCDDGDPCTSDICDTGSGACASFPILGCS